MREERVGRLVPARFDRLGRDDVALNLAADQTGEEDWLIGPTFDFQSVLDKKFARKPDQPSVADPQGLHAKRTVGR